jgi:hypothetical protein
MYFILSIDKTRLFAFLFSTYMTLYIDEKHNKWFRETNSELWPGQEFSIEIEEILYKQRSKYQDILVFKR